MKTLPKVIEVGWANNETMTLMFIYDSADIEQLSFFKYFPSHLCLLCEDTYNALSYDVAVDQWITSCHKNRMTTRVITFWRVHATSLTTSVSTMHFLIEILLILNAIKSHFKSSYDKQNLTLVVITYEIMKLAECLFHKHYMKWPLV